MKISCLLFLCLCLVSLSCFSQSEMPEEQLSMGDEAALSEVTPSVGLEKEPGGEFAEMPREEQEYDWQTEQELEAEQEYQLDGERNVY